MNDLKRRRQHFRKLHESFFVIPNAWNVGETRKLEKIGFKAVATTSAGLAASLGRDDLSLSRDETLENIRQLCAGTELPVNADFEAGFADDLAGVGESVSLAVKLGIAGLSIEDRKGDHLYDLPTAVARLKAARAALDAVDPNMILVGRSEGYLLGNNNVDATIERLRAYAAAGADVLYSPGISKPEDIVATVKAVAPKPVNVLIVSPKMTTGELSSLGVGRVSVGGFLASAEAAAFEAAATTLLRHGVLPDAAFG